MPVITENRELKGVLSVSELIFKFTEEKVNEYLPILKQTAHSSVKNWPTAP